MSTSAGRLTGGRWGLGIGSGNVEIRNEYHARRGAARRTVKYGLVGYGRSSLDRGMSMSSLVGSHPCKEAVNLIKYELNPSDGPSINRAGLGLAGWARVCNRHLTIRMYVLHMTTWATARITATKRPLTPWSTIHLTFPIFFDFFGLRFLCRVCLTASVSGQEVNHFIVT